VRLEVPVPHRAEQTARSYESCKVMYGMAEQVIKRRFINYYDDHGLWMLDRGIVLFRHHVQIQPVWNLPCLVFSGLALSTDVKRLELPNC